MRKPLTAFATGAIVATALVACSAESDSDTNDDGLSSTQIVSSTTAAVPDGDIEGESVPGDVEAVDIGLPITYSYLEPLAYSHLAGYGSPDSVGLLCVGDHAFLYTRYEKGYGGGSGTTRFAEQDELCADIQVIQE